MVSFLKLHKNKIFKASVILAVFSFTADLVALLRDRILASHFGASRTLDIYYSAFKIPDLIFNLLILGAVSSAFIPVFLEHYRTDEERAWRLSNIFLSTAFLGVIILSAFIFIFTRPLVIFVSPGFSGEDKELVIKLIRLMILSPIIFSVSTVIGSILQSLERFWAYAIAPALYNLGIIIGAIYIVPLMRASNKPEVLGLGIGVIIGALMHLLIQLIAVWRVGFRFKFILDFADNGLRKIFRLMIPRTLGLGAFSIDSVITNAFASTMATGSIAIYNFANNLQFVPISVLGVSIATAIFPKLSLHAAGAEIETFHYRLRIALKNTIMFVAPLAFGIFLFRKLIIRLLFGVGAFKGASVDSTATVLGIFMIGVVAHSLIPIMARAFYALQNTRTPVVMSLISILSNIILAAVFTFILHLGIGGLALAFSISGNINFLLLYFSFKKKYRIHS